MENKNKATHDSKLTPCPLHVKVTAFFLTLGNVGLLIWFCQPNPPMPPEPRTECRVAYIVNHPELSEKVDECVFHRDMSAGLCIDQIMVARGKMCQ